MSWRALGPLVAAVLALEAGAGELPIAWPAPADPRVVLHRVSYGAGTVGDSSASFDVPTPASSAVVQGLADCTEHHVATRACTAAACSTWSNVVKGWPAVRITGVALAGGVLTITGANFGPQAVVVELDGVDRTAGASVACQQVTLPASSLPAAVRVSALQKSGERTFGTFAVQLPPPGPPTIWRTDAQ